jgi:hypothetical protein
MGAILVTVVSAALAAGAGPEVDLGAVDQKPPTKDALVAPKKDNGVARVDLRTAVKGKAAGGEKRNLFVVVTPLSNPDLAGTWWVQQEVAREGESFTAESQFGEEDAGSGEYFAVLAVATNRKWSVGEKLTGLPEGVACSKLKIVRRK